MDPTKYRPCDYAQRNPIGGYRRCNAPSFYRLGDTFFCGDCADMVDEMLDDVDPDVMIRPLEFHPASCA